MEFKDLIKPSMVIVRFQKDHVHKAIPSFLRSFCNIECQVLLPSWFIKIVVVCIVWVLFWIFFFCQNTQKLSYLNRLFKFFKSSSKWVAKSGFSQNLIFVLSWFYLIEWIDLTFLKLNLLDVYSISLCTYCQFMEESKRGQVGEEGRERQRAL